jgi:hypothetical protein
MKYASFKKNVAFVEEGICPERKEIAGLRPISLQVLHLELLGWTP